MDMWQGSTSIEAEDEIEDLKHLKVNSEFKAKEVEENRKAHSSPSKSMRRTSDLFGESSQVRIIFFLDS